MTDSRHPNSTDNLYLGVSPQGLLLMCPSQQAAVLPTSQREHQEHCKFYRKTPFRQQSDLPHHHTTYPDANHISHHTGGHAWTTGGGNTSQTLVGDHSSCTCGTYYTVHPPLSAPVKHGGGAAVPGNAFLSSSLPQSHLEENRPYSTNYYAPVHGPGENSQRAVPHAPHARSPVRMFHPHEESSGGGGRVQRSVRGADRVQFASQQQFAYTDIERVRPELADNVLVMELDNKCDRNPKSYHMQMQPADKEEALLMVSAYAPHLTTEQNNRGSNWMKQANSLLLQRMARFTEEDRIRLQEEINLCRRIMIEQRMLNKPTEDGGFFKVTMRRLSKAKVERSAPLSPTSNCPEFSLFKTSYWSYTKYPIRQPMLILPHESLDNIALKMYNSLMIFSQRETFDDDNLEPYLLIQALVKKCLEDEDLCNECFMQIIKQTTDNSDPNGPMNICNWQVMTVLCSLVFPNHEVILRYLRAHLRKCAIDTTREEGKHAEFCQKCLARTLEKPCRKFPPSVQEIKALIERQTCQVKIHLLNGSHKMIDFNSHTTVEEILHLSMAKVGMKQESSGWSIFETIGHKERCANNFDFLGDVIYRWEIYTRNQAGEMELKLFLKKRIFIDPLINPADEVEVDLLAHQCITEVFEGVIPLNETMAVHLCALRATSEEGDTQAALRILPRCWRDKVDAELVTTRAQQFKDWKQHNLNLDFIETCRQADFFGASLFQVAQQVSNIWPLNILLAINQHGIHLLKSNDGHELLASYYFSRIASFNTEARIVLVIVLKSHRSERLVFRTKQTTQIAYLIRDYMLQLKLLPETALNQFTNYNQDHRRARSFLKPSKSVESTSNTSADADGNSIADTNTSNGTRRARSVPRSIPGTTAVQNPPAKRSNSESRTNHHHTSTHVATIAAQSAPTDSPACSFSAETTSSTSSDCQGGGAPLTDCNQKNHQYLDSYSTPIASSSNTSYKYPHSIISNTSTQHNTTDRAPPKQHHAVNFRTSLHTKQPTETVPATNSDYHSNSSSHKLFTHHNKTLLPDNKTNFHELGNRFADDDEISQLHNQFQSKVTLQSNQVQHTATVHRHLSNHVDDYSTTLPSSSRVDRERAANHSPPTPVTLSPGKTFRNEIGKLETSL